VSQTIPESIDAEACTIASLMLGLRKDAAMMATIFGMLIGGDFIYPAHGVLFDALHGFWKSGAAVDPIILREHLRQHGKLEEVGGTAYIAQCVDTVPSHTHGEHYAKIVKDASNRRKLIDSCVRAQAAANNPRGKTAVELAQELQAEAALIVTSDAGMNYQTANDLANEIMADMVAPAAKDVVRTGLPDLPVLHQGRFYILAGRPSMGKSLYGKTIIRGVAQAGAGIGLITPDETKQKVLNDMAAQLAGVNAEDIDERRLEGDAYQNYCVALDQLSRLPMYFSDECSTIEQADAMLSLWKARHNIKVAYLDYISLFGTKDREATSTTSRVTVVAKACKHLFRRLNVAGLVVSQLNRATQGRDDKRPALTDLRESGELEQAADVVIGIHRNGYYATDNGGDPPEDDYAEIWMLKNKSGARLKAHVMRAHMPTLRFLPMDRDSQFQYWQGMRGKP
jgi:replicative DNA helicase